MNGEYSTDSGGCSTVILAAVALLVVFAVFGAGAAAGGGDRTSTTSTQTETNVLSRNELMSRNTVRILSPDTYVYYNSGDTTTANTVDGDRNVVTSPVQTGGGQCWVSSSASWGNCPAGVPAGSAVP